MSTPAELLADAMVGAERNLVGLRRFSSSDEIAQLIDEVISLVLVLRYYAEDLAKEAKDAVQS